MGDPVWIILACAVATYATRAGGHVVLSRFPRIHHRVEAALDAVPTAVLASIVAPSIVSHGWPEAAAIAATALLASRFSMTVAVTFGLVALVGLRALSG